MSRKWFLLSLSIIILFAYYYFHQSEVIFNRAPEVAFNQEIMGKCGCDGEMFCLSVDADFGEKFNCSLLQFLQKFQLTEKSIAETVTKDFSFKDVVFVTYASSNHFGESRQMLIDFRKNYNNKIIYYDLGLKNDEKAELSNVCNLEYRKFVYSNYPKHVSERLTYAFKIIIQAEVMTTESVFWTADTSTSFKNSSLFENFYADVMSGKAPNYMVGPFNTKDIDYTHPDMFRYLPFPKRYHEERQREASVLFMRRSPESKRILKWLLLCGLTEKCISPKSARVHCGRPPKKGCHRYDQSASSLLFRIFYPPSSKQNRYNQSCAITERDRVSKRKLPVIRCTNS